jgi:hypothetical protein
MFQRSRTNEADELELTALTDAMRAIDMAEIAADSWASGEATMRSVLELLAELGLLAGRALGFDGAWLDDRRG